METGVSMRPVQPAGVTLTRPVVAPERQTVRTELPEVKTVSPVPEVVVDTTVSGQQRALRSEIDTVLDQRRAVQTQRELQRKVDFDKASGEIVFSRVDPDTGAVVTQFPDDALLRQKAYVRQVEIEQVTAESTNPYSIVT